MLLNTITLDGVVFDKITFVKNESTYSSESNALTDPKRLRVSHNVRKNGIVDTLIQSEHQARPVAPDGTTLLPFSAVRAQLKISYNPFEGRQDIQAALIAQKTMLVELFDAELASLLNKEV